MLPAIYLRSLYDDIIITQYPNSSYRYNSGQEIEFPLGYVPFPSDLWFSPYNKQDVLGLLPHRDIPFVLYGKEITKELRRGFNGVKKDFRLAAYEECRRAVGISKDQFKTITRDYDIHHKLPSHMGGTNDFDNLVFIDPNLHGEIHRRIDQIMKKIQKINRDYEKSKKPKSLSRTEVLLIADEAIHLVKGQIFITIPWPEGKLCIPQLVIDFNNWAQLRAVQQHRQQLGHG